MEQDLQSLIDKYLALEKVPQHIEVVKELINQNDETKLRKIIGRRLEFGTAGLRGRMGPGFNQMNDLVIIQTSQGLASYLLSTFPKDIKTRGVIIGNDARHNSDRFARLAALAFLQKDIPVHFCDHIIPTPLIAFGVKHFDCCAGIMVTASHNPKHDNGYKVYWSNGAQILSPHDKNIQMHILADENQTPWPQAWHHETILPESSQSESWNNILYRVHGDLSKCYFAYIENMIVGKKEINQSADISITYTSMHGVGHMFLSRALDIAGFDSIFPVELQKKPDPNFSTVKFPNPEEAGALDLAFETAKHANSNLILANDPDADRCAVAIYDPKTEYKRVFNGNEIGALLGWWIWHNYKNSEMTDTMASYSYVDSRSDSATDNDNAPTESSISSSVGITKKEPKDCFMISTAVSSKFLQSMAKVEGFNFLETLTGFKYMGNAAEELINNNKHVLFAFEEAIGYMIDSKILDKDGISAAVQIAQCASYVSIHYKRTLEEQLDSLYLTYGYHCSANSYFICYDPLVTKKIFDTIQADYPMNFGSDFKVTRVRDLNNGFDSAAPDRKATLPTSSNSYMITFFINDNITFTIRTSGTEPKIKYYSEIVAKLPPITPGQEGGLNGPNQIKAKQSAQKKLDRLVSAAIEHCLKPDENGIEPA